MIHANCDWDIDISVHTFFAVIVPHITPVVVTSNFQDYLVFVLLKQLEVVCLLVFHPERARCLLVVMRDPHACIDVRKHQELPT